MYYIEYIAMEKKLLDHVKQISVSLYLLDWLGMGLSKILIFDNISLKFPIEIFSFKSQFVSQKMTLGQNYKCF